MPYDTPWHSQVFLAFVHEALSVAYHKADYLAEDIRLRAPDPSDMAGKGKDSAGDLCSPLLRSRTLAIMLMWFAAGFSY